MPGGRVWGKMDSKRAQGNFWGGTGLSVMLLLLMVSQEQLNKDAIKKGGERKKKKEKKSPGPTKTIEI